MTSAPAAPEVADNSHEVTAALLNAVHELFADVVDHTVLPTSKIEVTFYPAKFKHLKQITQLYGSIVSALTNSELSSMMVEVSKQQEALINEGVSPYQTDPNGLVKKLMSNGSIALKLLDGLTTVTPQLAAMFTSLSPEEFEDLEMDEVMIVVYAIFSRNYNFFTLRLLPLIAAFTVDLQRTRK